MKSRLSRPHLAFLYQFFFCFLFLWPAGWLAAFALHYACFLLLFVVANLCTTHTHTQHTLERVVLLNILRHQNSIQFQQNVRWSPSMHNSSSWSLWMNLSNRKVAIFGHMPRSTQRTQSLAHSMKFNLRHISATFDTSTTFPRCCRRARVACVCRATSSPYLQRFHGVILNSTVGFIFHLHVNYGFRLLKFIQPNQPLNNIGIKKGFFFSLLRLTIELLLSPIHLYFFVYTCTLSNTTQKKNCYYVTITDNMKLCVRVLSIELFFVVEVDDGKNGI